MTHPYILTTNTGPLDTSEIIPIECVTIGIVGGCVAFQVVPFLDSKEKPKTYAVMPEHAMIIIKGLTDTLARMDAGTMDKA